MNISWSPHEILFQDLLSLPGYMRMRKDKLSFIQFKGHLLDPRIKDGVLELKDLKPLSLYKAGNKKVVNRITHGIIP